MASKSSTVTATFLHSLLVQILLFSFVTSDEAVCDNFCPRVGSVDDWQTRCHLQQSTAFCGASVVRDVPSAPSKLIAHDFIHETQGARLLALNITWVLPVTGNFTGLEGFYVHVLKTSYPVGYNECNGIRFDHTLTVSSFASEILFHFSCLRGLDVDSLYNIKITSIGSNKSIKLDGYHTSNCAIIPGVGRCPSTIVTADDWKPEQIPTATVSGNSVTVVFSTYSGDTWITYKINLRPCNGDVTPRALSKIVNTTGATGRHSFVFENVPPGCYKARVSLYNKTNGNLVDGFEVPSEPFNVTRVQVKTTEAPADQTSAVRTSPQRPEGPTTQTDVSENTDVNQATKPVPNTILTNGLIGAGIGIAVALILLLTFVVKQRQKPNTQSETVSETPRACLTNNMVQNDLTDNCNAYGQGSSPVTEPGYCDVYGQGSSPVTEPGYRGAYGDSVSVFRSECSQCCDHAGYPDDPDDFLSVTNMSGIAV